MPPAVASLASQMSLASGREDRKEGKGASGLGFARENEANLASEHDAFEGYFQQEKPELKGTVIAHSSTGYQTVYDPASNTYTTSLTPSAASLVGETKSRGSNVAGFVAGRSQKDSLPVASYGGPDDEWDSSKMAIESALAAIQARRKEEERSQSHRN